MKLRFEIDQADSFRRGIDRPKSIVSIEVNPADIPEEQRALLGQHLEGIDVLQLFFRHGEVIRGFPIKELCDTAREPKRIVAKAANLEALLAATKSNHEFISRFQEEFRKPVQFRLIQKPPADESEFQLIQTSQTTWIVDASGAIRQMRRISFECLIHDVQTQLSELLNSHSYLVYLMPVPHSTACARFYCEPTFVGDFSGREIRAHSPTVVYNERSGRIVQARNLIHALDIYLLNSTGTLNDLSILSWESGRWSILSPEALVGIANESTATRTDWKRGELDRKMVEFEIPVKTGTAKGIGQFWVQENPDGLLFIDIVTDMQGRSWAERIQTRFHMPQEAVGRIVRHPKPEIADFLVR